MQLPCSTGIISKNNMYKGTQNALFVKNLIWQPGSEGRITITFGSYKSTNCSGCAAWSEIGSNSNGSFPSMNLGFIDPPFGDFFIGVDGEKYTIPMYSPQNCPCESIDCCDCNTVGKSNNNPTRNYCSSNSNSISDCLTGSNWIPGATIIHEFGHALGMMHEHQNNYNNSNILEEILDKDAVNDYYIKLNNGNINLGKDDAATNVLTFYSDPSDFIGSDFDNKSIMLYYLPNSWLIGCKNYRENQRCPSNPTFPNFTLSETDKKWLILQYPKTLDKDNWPKLYVDFIDPDAKQWKIAWVIKVIVETFEPLVGITWTFRNYKNEVMTVKQDTQKSQGDQTNQDTQKSQGDQTIQGDQTKQNDQTYTMPVWLIVIIVIIIVIVICLVIYGAINGNRSA